MKPSRIVAAAMLVLTGFALQLASAQQPGVKRTELQRQDLSVPGREVIQVRVDFDPGVTFPMHSHPGEEVAYVLEGELQYQVEGKGATTLKTGDTMVIPAGVKHAVKNIGSVRGSELATYIVEKGKPLVVLAKP
jgi:quercetin dioxygenase-like cupin family protein